MPEMRGRINPKNVELTEIGVESSLASRDIVRSWLEVKPEFERAAREVYERHKDALRQAVAAAAERA